MSASSASSASSMAQLRRHDKWRWWTGILVSSVVHAAVLFGPRLFPTQPRAKPVRAAEEDVVQLVMPPEDPEPEKLEEVQDKPEAGSPSDFAPPKLEDFPTLAPPDAFVQPIQPPIANLPITHNLITIPSGPPGRGNGQGLGNIFDVGSLDQAPEARARAQPLYPESLKRQGIVGEVEIDYIIDASGCVTCLTIIRSSRPEFEAPVASAVQRWTYKPGRKAGRSVNTHVHQVISFSLGDR